MISGKSEKGYLLYLRNITKFIDSFEIFFIKVDNCCTLKLVYETFYQLNKFRVVRN